MTPFSKLLTAAALTVSTAHAAAPPIPHQEFVCVSSTEERIIALYNQFTEHANAGCRVEYTKNGHTQVLWSSKGSRGYCTGKATQLATRLAQDNFRCTPRTFESAEDSSP